MVKLQAERRDGELEDGTLHSLLVKKLPDRQLENYSRWLNERTRQKVFKGNKRKNVSAESQWQLQSCELERPSE